MLRQLACLARTAFPKAARTHPPHLHLLRPPAAAVLARRALSHPPTPHRGYQNEQYKRFGDSGHGAGGDGRWSGGGGSHSRRTWREVIVDTRFIAGAGIGSAVALWWGVNHLEENEWTGRKRLIAMTHDEEIYLGDVTLKQILAQSRGHVLPANHPVTLRVRRVAERLIRSLENAETARTQEFLEKLQWQFFVVDNRQANAMCLPGGKVVVFTGILPILRTDEELAVILAHEISHSLGRHAAEKSLKTKLLMTAQLLLGMFFEARFITDALTTFGILLPFSRALETEADYMGLQLMTRACYNPRVAPTVFARLAKVAREAPMEWLSTHPAHETRVEAFERWMPRATADFDDKCAGQDADFVRRAHLFRTLWSSREY